jgi:hypothetical protein
MPAEQAAPAEPAAPAAPAAPAEQTQTRTIFRRIVRVCVCSRENLRGKVS